MPTRKEIYDWIKAHDAYEWNANRIAKEMLLEAIENTAFAEWAYPGLKEKIKQVIINTELPDETSERNEQ